MDHQLHWISQSLFTRVNGVIGDEVIVDIRRAVTNLRDDVVSSMAVLHNMDKEQCYSGSKAEGFRFESSDEDWMFLRRNIKVIPSDEFAVLYDSNTTLLLMDNEMTKPGFTLLRIHGDQVIEFCTERFANRNYVSCKSWREEFTKESVPDFTHGPCTSGFVGRLEFDLAFCLQSDVWPTNAKDSIQRLYHIGWPSCNVIRDIVNEGILFVPIGAKQSIFENMEWRMSFSLAEKRLMHAMNQTQFLCYGLLKLFLKEAIDANENAKGLFCSYFLKTALFWEIVSSPSQWFPSSLLTCFWNCFSRLLQWVSASYCPNFFIPQNNMFGGKIECENRIKLLRYLGTLYTEGYTCLLRCPSLSHWMTFILFGRPRVIVRLTEPHPSWIALNTISETLKACFRIPFRNNQDTACIHLQRFISHTDCSLKRFIAGIWLYQSLTTYCITYPNQSQRQLTQLRCNKMHYKRFVKRMNMLDRCRTDAICHNLYKAMLCYNHGKYSQCLELVQHSVDFISHGHYMYRWALSEDRYRKLGGGSVPIATIMRKYLLDSVRFAKDQYIEELTIEIYGRNLHFASSDIPIPFPPLIFAFFLKFLSYHKLGLRDERDEVLFEFRSVVRHDEGHHISHPLRAISWQTLGICHHITGDNWRACKYYIMAKQQDVERNLEMAPCIRLGTILGSYFNSENRQSFTCV